MWDSRESMETSCTVVIGPRSVTLGFRLFCELGLVLCFGEVLEHFRAPASPFGEFGRVVC